MTNWFKYTFICDPEECDTMIEVTVGPFNWPNGVIKLTCPCGREMQYLSVQDATIPSSTTTKEETMNEAEEYIKRQNDTLAELIQTKDELILRLQSEEENHKNCDYWKAENGRIGSQVIDLINASYDGDEDASFILESLCDIIDYRPVKTVQFEGVIHFSGSMDIPRSEVADFDLTSALEDVYVDINNGDVVIDNYELYSVEEPY